MSRRLILIITLGALAGIVVIPLNPEHDKLRNVAFLVALSGAWLGTLTLIWRRKVLRICLIALAVLLAIPFLLPGGKMDRDELRDDYVRRLKAFEGTKYDWGGESPRGIDCSGLPRRALRDALLAYGIRHLDGRAMRLFVEQWWHDASARALGQGYRSYTVPLGSKGTIADMSYANLAPGDLAVTESGVHVMAYAGDNEWIQADPGIGTVATLNGRTSDNGWFHVPVTMHRWSVLDARGAGSDRH